MAHAASKAERIATQRQRAQRKAKLKNFAEWRREQAALDYKQSLARHVELEHSDDIHWQQMQLAHAEAARNSWM
jgi:hypothetical protein